MAPAADQEKFDEMLAFARALPHVRAVAAKHVKLHGMPRNRVLACAVRLLDRGFFRIGGEDYAEQNQTYGLATMQKRHVTVGEGGLITFDYEAKGGKHQIQSIVDPHVCEVISELKRRRSGRELLAYKPNGRWIDVRSADINGYIKEVTGADFSAKDFRTWNATVLAAVGLAVSGRAASTPTARKRAVTRAIKEVSHYLGNTPAVAGPRTSTLASSTASRTGSRSAAPSTAWATRAGSASPQRKARSRRPFSTCSRKKTRPRSKTSPRARERAAGR